MIKHNTDRWVLVPGTLCTADVFKPMLEKLGVALDRCKFIPADAPRVEDYKQPLSQAVKGGEIVCGFSLGALIVTHNLDVLKRAKAIILLACNPFPDPKENRASRKTVRNRILAGDARGWVNENWSAMSTDAGKEVKDRVALMAEATAHLIPAQTELAMSRPGAESLILNSNIPLIFVIGSEDQLTPADPIRKLIQNSRQAVLRVVDGLGHFALMESPERVAQVVLEELNELPQSILKVSKTDDAS